MCMCMCVCVHECVEGCQWVQAMQCCLPVCAQVRGFFKSQWLGYGTTSLTFCHGPNWSPCDPPGTFNAARAELSNNGVRRAMNDELVGEILRCVVVQIKTVQHLLPLCECISNRTLFSTRVSECAESACGLEHDLQVLLLQKSSLG
jgi:hypothetical protein